MGEAGPIILLSACLAEGGVEAPVSGQVGGVAVAQVPLTHQVGGVSRILQVLTNHRDHPIRGTHSRICWPTFCREQILQNLD